MKRFNVTRKCLQWGLSSLLLSGCVVYETKKVPLRPFLWTNTVDVVQLAESNDQGLGKIVINGVLEQSFTQGKDNHELVYHDEQGNPVDAGPNFLDYRCTVSSQNVIVYGHSSKTSSILFTPLVQYLDEQFAQKNSRITLELSGRILEFQLISVFLFHVEKPSDNDWMQIDFQKDFLFEQALIRLKERSIHDFEDLHGSQLLTLVTCNPSNGKERIILVAVR